MPSPRIQEKYEDYEPFEIFNLFFTDDLINSIVEPSNVYIRKLRSSFRFLTLRNSRKKDHEDITGNEYRVFLGMKIFFNFNNNHGFKGNNNYIN